MAAFPDARLTNKGEITLRVSDAISANRWLQLIFAAEKSEQS
jgi:hypothetical protein